MSPWPAASVAVGDVITASQLNLLPIQIADSTASGAVSSFDFTSLPGQFAHLLVELIGRGDTVATSVDCYMRFNNDTAANYDWQYVRGNASTVSAAESFGGTPVGCYLGSVPAASATSGVGGHSVSEVAQYAGTTFQKSVTTRDAVKTGTSTGNLSSFAIVSFWRNTAAITRVTVLPSAGNFATGSRCTIYGLA